MCTQISKRFSNTVRWHTKHNWLNSDNSENAINSPIMYNTHAIKTQSIRINSKCKWNMVVCGN